MDGKGIQNIVDGIREQAKLKNKEACYELLKRLIEEIKSNDELSYLKKEELVKFVNRAFLLFHDYTAAEAFFNGLLVHEETTVRKNGKYTATVLNLLGELYYYMGDFDSAEKKYDESLEIRKQEFGDQHPLTIECKSNLALLLTERGKFRESEMIYNSIVSVYEREMNDFLEEYLYTLLNIGLLYWKWGKYSDSINYYIKAHEISKESGFKKFSAEVENNIGVLNIETGNYEEAKRYLSESEELYTDIFPADHPFLIETLNNLAFSELHLGDFTSAKLLLEDVLKKIPENRRKHYIYAKIAANLSSIYLSEKDFEKSESMIKQLLEQKVIKLEPETAVVVRLNLAKMRLFQERYEESLSIITALLEEQKNDFGEKTIQYTKILSLKSLALIQLERYDKAAAELQKAVAIQNEILFDVSTSFSRDYAWNFLYRIADDINIYLSFFAEKGDKSQLSCERVYDTILKRKGIVFETNIERYRNLLSEKNPLLRKQYDELIKLKEEIILRTTKGFFHEAKEANETRIRELNDEISVLENRISMAIPSYRLEREIKNVSLKTLRERLQSDILFVDFFKFRRFDFENPQNKFIGESYIIFYIDNEGIRYEIIEDADVMDKQIRQTDINRNPDNRGISESSEEETGSNEEILGYLYQRIFSGMKESGAERYSKLCISTDGEFTKLPFETLLNGEGRYLIEDFEIYYVSSGRSLIRAASTIREKEAAEQQKDVILFANPEFYVQNDQKEPADKDRTDRFRGSSTVFRNELDEFPPLPGTKEEVEKINSLIDRNKIRKISIYYRKDVNDSKVKQLNSPLILHLATHSFYLETRKDIHPFSRCGIALSGVNNMLRGEHLEPFLEDGLLTATDSLSLRLMDTELVILSACRTGAGEVRNGEGVLGLSSAFLCAGASSVILSLWNVPDFFTVELMTAFYEGIFAGYTKSKALRDAKLKMIGKLRAQWGEAPTWIWGGFILFGDNNPVFG